MTPRPALGDDLHVPVESIALHGHRDEGVRLDIADAMEIRRTGPLGFSSIGFIIASSILTTW